MEEQVFVTLFHNDGLLETRLAKPFRINRTWSNTVLHNSCHMRMYNRACPSARLFNQTGIEMDSPLYIQYGDSLIVSSGESFVPINYLSMVPPNMKNDTQLVNMLQTLHEPSNMIGSGEADAMVTSERLNMNEMVETAMKGLYPSGTKASSHLPQIVHDIAMISTPNNGGGPPRRSSLSSPGTNHQLDILFDNMYLPSMDMSSPTQTADFLSTTQTTGPLSLPPIMTSHNLPLAGPPVMQQPTHNPLTPASPADFIYPVTTAQPSAHLPSNQGVAPALNAMTTSPTVSPAPPASLIDSRLRRQSSISSLQAPWNESTGSLSPSMQLDLSPVSLYSAGVSQPFALGNNGSPIEMPSRVISHKASEQRSRAKLKGCLSELCLTVPGLRQVKKPTKATVLKKATEYMQETNSKYKEAKQAAEALAKDNEVLITEKEELIKKLEISSISTLEITDVNNRFIFVDPTWEIVLGYKRQEVVGKLVHDLVDCPTCPFMHTHRDVIKTSLETGQEWAGITVGIRNDGRAFVCETTITPMMCDNKVQQYITRRR
eukprot:Ihof_evm12s11 gene=Ihof_evmTU12s11